MSLLHPAVRFPSELTLSSKVGFGVDSVFIDGVDVVFGRLQRPELGAQVTVLAAVGTSGAWQTEGIWRLGKLTQRRMDPRGCNHKMKENAAKGKKKKNTERKS